MTDTDPKPASDELRPVAAKTPFRGYLGAVWERRDFVLRVPRNTLRAQNSDTVLGNLWLLVNPALQVTVYFTVFGLRIHRPSTSPPRRNISRKRR